MNPTSLATDALSTSKDSGAFASGSFSRALRLRRSRDFRYIQRVGARGNTSALVVVGRAVPRGRGRAGLTVSRKVGKAHERNLVKRRLRHWLRTHKEAFLARDVVLIVHPGAAALPFDALTAAVQEAFARMEAALAKHPRAGRGRPGARSQQGTNRRP